VRLSVLVADRLDDDSACVNRVSPAPLGPSAAVCVNAVAVVGVPVGTVPNTSEVGIFTDPLVKAAVAEAKYASRITFARLAARVHVVVMATGALPLAVPPATSAKVTAVGEAETVKVSLKVAVNDTLPTVEFNWPTATPETRTRAAAMNVKRIELLRKPFIRQLPR
jgi:hypothetical protein